MKHRDLNASPRRKMSDIVQGIYSNSAQGATGAHGIKHLGRTGDTRWYTSDGSEYSVRNIASELAEAQDRIDEAENILEQARIEMEQAGLERDQIAQELETLETVTIPAAVQALEAADQAAQEQFNELDTRLGDFATDEALAPIRQALSDAQATATSASQAAAAADQAASAASQAALEAAGIAASKGRVIIQDTEPTGDDRQAANIWIKPAEDDPDTEIVETATTYVYIVESDTWMPTTSDELAQAAQNALDAREAAQQATQRAETAISNAATAQSAAEAAQQTANTATTDAREAHNEAVAAREAADAAMTSALNANLVDDPSFESLNPAGTAFTRWTNPAGAEIETENVHGGKRAVRHTATGTYSVVGSVKRFPITPNRFYKIGGWVYISEDVGGMLDGSQFVLMAMRADNSYVWVPNRKFTNVAPGQWTYIESNPWLNQDTFRGQEFVEAQFVSQASLTSGYVIVDDVFMADVTDAVKAQQIADAAQARAEEAYGKAESAETKAGNAETSAAQAAADLIEARERATAAATDAAAAFADAEKAEQAARDAGLLVSEAEQAADDAATAAGNALAQAQASGTSASQAQTAAQAASDAADEAERQAGLANTEAANADAAAARAAADAAQAAADLVIARDAAEAAEAKAQAAQDAADRAMERATSPTSNMIHNGSGHFGNENFTSSVWNRYPEDTPAGAGASFGITHPGTAWLNKRLAVDPSRKYRMTATVRQANPDYAGSDRFYMALVPYDADGLNIGTWMYSRYLDTLTTLAEPLNPGDTTATLASTEGWRITSYKSLVIYEYVDGSGKHWGTEYSRIRQDFDSIEGNVLTLQAPWAGEAYPAGTQVGQGLWGGSYMYPASPTNIPHEWTPYESNVLGGIHDGNGAVATYSFPAPVASVQPGFLLNYTNQTESRHRVANVGFFDITEAVAAQARADEAWELADSKPDMAEVKTEIATSVNGKNSITRSTANASGSGVVAGDAWYKVDSNGDTMAMWIWDGSKWVASKVRNEMIDTIDVNKLKVHNDLEVIGDAVIDKLWADGIAAKSAVFNSLTVAASNIYPDPKFETRGQWAPNALVTGAGYSGGNAVVRTGRNVGVYELTTATPTPVPSGVKDAKYRVTFWYKSSVAGTGIGRINYGRIVDGTRLGAQIGKYVDAAQANTWYQEEIILNSGSPEVTGFYFGFYNSTTDGFSGTVTYSDLTVTPLVGAVMIEDGAITTPKLTVTEDMSAAIVNAMSVNTKKLVVTEEAVLNHAKLLGTTIVDDINVTGKLVGTGGVFTGTVDFANINVTGEVLAENLTGSVIRGAEISTSLSGAAPFLHLGNSSGWPAIVMDDGVRDIPATLTVGRDVDGWGPHTYGGVFIEAGRDATDESHASFGVANGRSHLSTFNPSTTQQTALWMYPERVVLEYMDGDSPATGLYLTSEEVYTDRASIELRVGGGGGRVSASPTTSLITARGGHTYSSTVEVGALSSTSGGTGIALTSSEDIFLSGKHPTTGNPYFVQGSEIYDYVRGSGWSNLPLGSSWSPRSSGGYFSGIRVRRNGNSLEINGAVQGGSSGSQIATIPPSLRPINDTFVITTLAGGGLGQAFVGKNGSIMHSYGANSPGFLAFNVSIPLD